MNISQSWGFISAAVIIILPVISELADVYAARKQRLNESQDSEDVMPEKVITVTKPEPQPAGGTNKPYVVSF